MPQSEARAGRCAIVGSPNVGKSTLLNALLGQKLAIATPKPQTTRASLLGVYGQVQPPTQIAFVDTPGMHKPRNALGRALVEEAKAGLQDADVVLWVMQVSDRTAPETFFDRVDDGAYELLAAQGRPVILALNKVDRMKDKRRLLPLLERCQRQHDFAAIVPISATRGTNLEALVEEIRKHLPEGMMYPEELLTDRPERFFAAELIREAVIRHTRQEVPHSVAVLIEEFRDEPKLTRIGATIVVEKPTQKAIVIGTGGKQLKQIGTDARVEIQQLLGRKVHLQLWVKVVKGWTRDPASVRRLAQEMAG